MLPLPQVTFDRLAQLIHGLCGLVLTNDKTYLIHHRLEPIVTQSGLRDYDELCDRLRSPTLSPLHEQVIEAITTHETSFFRDSQSFEALRQVLLPELIEAAGQRKRALGVRPHGRIWCAGASTGEEAYSVAMLLDELVQSRPRRDLDLGDFGFLATDISPGVLDVARAGVYNARDVARVRPRTCAATSSSNSTTGKSLIRCAASSTFAALTCWTARRARVRSTSSCAATY